MTDAEIISALDRLYLAFLEQSVSVEGVPDWAKGFDVLATARDRLRELTDVWARRVVRTSHDV